jgi:hypothetical protein
MDLCSYFGGKNQSEFFKNKLFGLNLITNL